MRKPVVAPSSLERLHVRTRLKRTRRRIGIKKIKREKGTNTWFYSKTLARTSWGFFFFLLLCIPFKERLGGREDRRGVSQWCVRVCVRMCVPVCVRTCARSRKDVCPLSTCVRLKYARVLATPPLFSAMNIYLWVRWANSSDDSSRDPFTGRLFLRTYKAITSPGRDYRFPAKLCSSGFAAKCHEYSQRFTYRNP